MPLHEFPRVLGVDHQWFNAFQSSATPQQKADVREFADLLQREMEKRGYAAKKDDREQILIGALARYLIQSQQ